MLAEVVKENIDKNTMFTTWIEANKTYGDGRNLTYDEFPMHFVYHVHKREWHPSKQGVSIRRLNFIPLGTRKLFYMRLLLNVQRGCTSYYDIRTFNVVTYESFKETCYAMGLLTND